MISTQQIAVIALVLSQILPVFGITVASEALETTIQALVAIGSGIWVWYTNKKLHKAIEVGGVATLGGFRA